jgi:glycerol transport system ATP-binding protein
MLGGNIVVLDEGRVLQTGPTPYVYHHPENTRVATVFSDPPINFLSGVVQGRFAKLGEDIGIPMVGHLESVPNGNYLFGVRPNHLFLTNGNEKNAEIRVKVELAEINGSETFIHVCHGDAHLVIQEDGIHTKQIGSEIAIYVDPCCFFVYDQAGQLVASPASNGVQK